MQTLSPAAEHAIYFQKFIRLLVDKYQPLQIYCISKGSALADTKGCFLDQEIQYNCNYCLLLITESLTRIDHEVQDFSNFHYQQGSITVLCHGKESILHAIKANNRFFITACNTGQLIYTHDGMTVQDYSTPFIPTHAATKAIKHFSHRILLAEGFLNGAGECLSKGQFAVSTFMLHQVVEQCCITLVRVHLAYRSEIHNLKRMLSLCRAFSEKPYQLFLAGNTEDQRLFELLLRSYSGARYASAFSVAEKDATILFAKVSSFLVMTKALCNDKIEKLGVEAAVYQELKQDLNLINSNQLV